MAHGLCAMITYVLWWYKPLNLTDPTPIRGQRAREACALMAICSMKHDYLAGGIMSIHLPAELDHLTTLPPNNDGDDNNRTIKLQAVAAYAAAPRVNDTQLLG